MTFEEKLIQEETEALRQKGLIGPNETSFDFSKHILDETNGCLCTDTKVPGVPYGEDESLLQTMDIIVESYKDPVWKSVSVDPKLMDRIKEAEARRDG